MGLQSAKRFAVPFQKEDTQTADHATGLTPAALPHQDKRQAVKRSASTAAGVSTPVRPLHQTLRVVCFD
jgi:hypothetical protein